LDKSDRSLETGEWNFTQKEVKEAKGSNGTYRKLSKVSAKHGAIYGALRTIKKTCFTVFYDPPFIPYGECFF